jgi:hypothetical protein
MSLNQATIYQKKRLLLPGYDGRNDSGLVKLKITSSNVNALKAHTKIKIKIDAKGSKTLHKDKSSESSSFYDLCILPTTATPLSI